MSASADQQLLDRVRDNPWDFNAWTALVEHCEAAVANPSTGTENNTTSAIDSLRDAYSRFLTEFPLVFGFWKRFAEFEASVGGWEAADAVYRKAVGAVPHSVDIWVYYATFLQQYGQNELARAVFEEAEHIVGIDFVSQAFWDAWIAFESAQQQLSKVVSMLKRIICIPLRDLDRYWETLRQYVQTLPLPECVSDGELAALEDDSSNLSESQIRERLLASFEKTYQSTLSEVAKRKSFEAGIRRYYFHYAPLDENQLNTWRRYLDLEELIGSRERVVKLYERCLIPCCYYSEFWKRYVTYLDMQGDYNTAREVLYRALHKFLRSRPGMYIFGAEFEEALGNVEQAVALFEHSLQHVSPGHPETIVRYAHFRRRSGQPEEAKTVFSSALSRLNVKSDAKAFAFLSVEYARLLQQVQKNDIAVVRAVFRDAVNVVRDNTALWLAFADFEILHGGEASAVFEEAVGSDDQQSASAISRDERAQLLQAYVDYLLVAGPDVSKLRETEARLARLVQGPRVGKKRPVESYQAPSYAGTGVSSTATGSGLGADGAPSAKVSRTSLVQDSPFSSSSAAATSAAGSSGSAGTSGQTSEWTTEQWQAYWAQNPEAYQQYVQQYYAAAAAAAPSSATR